MSDLDVTDAVLQDAAARLVAMTSLPAFAERPTPLAEAETGSASVATAVGAAHAMRARLVGFTIDHLERLASDAALARAAYGYADGSLAGEVP